MMEKMQTDDVLSRQAVFVRCCLYQPIDKIMIFLYNMTQGDRSL